MPDPAPSNFRLPVPRVPLAPQRDRAARYVELHCKTNFSFLEGASHPDELVARAVELGYQALAITDRNSLAGIVRAYAAAKGQPLKLIYGAELTPHDAPPVVAWATDRASYGRLARMITRGRRNAPKGEFRLGFDELAEHSAGLLMGLAPPAEGADFAAALADGALPSALARYRELLRDRCYLLAELHRGPDDERRLAQLVALARRARVPLVAAGDVHYHVRSRLPLYDVLCAVRRGTTVAAVDQRRFPNAERSLRSAEEMRRRFAAAPEALAHAREVAARACFSLDELRYEYPEELAPAGQTPLAYLTRLVWQGARRRYPQGIPEKVRGLLAHELELIAELRYEAYFLTVFDLVRFARRRGILCQGRGSAANSVVCYALGITSVDPARLDVLFERFVSRERGEAPDIDVDFEHQRREEVLQYLYQKYGRERAGIAAEVITYRPRSAVRDVGKALGLSLDRVDTLAKTLDGYHGQADLPQRCREAGIDPESAVGGQLLRRVEELLGFPRHLGQHVGGMVITRGPLCELVPIENAAMDDRTVIEWDKNDLDELGILKVDILALGMLTAIRKAFALVERHTGRRLTLASVPPEDPAVYDMICRADTMGVFQIESRAQMSMLPRLRPRSYYDLVIEVAIVRPGPIQGNMVHPYLRRRAGEEPVSFPNQAIRGVLEKTLGVPLFQEQAMRLAVVAAGFTPGEADQLRRAMGAWRKTGVIERFRQKLIDGMLARGLGREFAEQVFRQIRGFGEYGFPESHAASFALLVYVSAWLKHHHPAAFAAALVNSQPMGFYAPAQLVRNAREHGVEVRPVDVNHSQWECTLETEASGEWRVKSEECGRSGCPLESRLPNSTTPHSPLPTPHSPFALRLGLRLIAGLPASAAAAIVAARAAGPFASLDDLVRRTGLGRGALAQLAAADAFGSLALDRRAALWQSLGQESSAAPRPLLQGLADDEPLPALPPLPEPDQVLIDYRALGLSLRAHPLQFQRAQLDAWRIVPAARLAALRDGRWVRVAGLVLVRQRPGTAKGITFVTLEDETGTANLIVRPEVWQRYRRAARSATALVAHGRLQNQQGVIHVLAARLEDLSALLRGLRSASRDFH